MGGYIVHTQGIAMGGYSTYKGDSNGQGCRQRGAAGIIIIILTATVGKNHPVANPVRILPVKSRAWNPAALSVTRMELQRKSHPHRDTMPPSWRALRRPK